MIDLTTLQLFTAEVCNLYEICLIYRLVTRELSPKKALIDAGVSLLIVCLPFPANSFYLLFLAIYFWLPNRLRLHPNTIINSIDGILAILVLSLTFDLVDHFLSLAISHQPVKLWGWLYVLSDLLITISVALIIKRSATVQNFIHLIQKYCRHSIRLWKLFMIILGCYLLSSVVSEFKGIGNSDASVLLINDFSLLLISVLLFINIFHSYQQIERQTSLISKYQSQMASAKQLNQQYQATRKERHDLKNILLSLQGYVNDGDFQHSRQLLNYLLQSNLVSKSSYQKIDQNLAKLKIASVRNLINAKVSQLAEQNIPFSIEINQEVTTLPGSEITTVRIIGVLLDNAIEAVQNQDHPFVQLALLKYSEKTYEFIVRNSLNQAFNINEAVQAGATHKSGHQGVGLTNVTELVDDDDHYSFSAEIKNNQITMTCFIQRDSGQ